MTADGWLQIVLYSVALLLVTKPVGTYLYRVFDGSMKWLAPLERAIYRLCGVDPGEDQHWTAVPDGHAAVQRGVHAADVRRRSGCRTWLPLNPAAPRRRSRPPGVRDRGIVHDQYELAVVQRRDDDVVLLADDPARLPQLHVGRHRHRAGHRARARYRAAVGAAGSATSGWTSSAARYYVLLPALPRARALLRAAGRDPELQAVRRRHHAGGRQADDRDGAGGEPGGDQAARHQRRRVLQRQLGASVREPDAVDQLLADARDLRRSRRGSCTPSG